MNELNLNIDSKTLEQCLRSVNNFGSTTYQNICTNQATTVQWGTVDYAVAIVLFLIAIGFISLIIRIMFDW